VCNLDSVHPKPSYDANGNVFFPVGDVAHSRLLLSAGEVAVLLPQDAHAPSLQVNDGEIELVRKIVVKVMDAHLMDGIKPTPIQSTAQNSCPGGQR
jgi:beta-galactosidase beta subunit